MNLTMKRTRRGGEVLPEQLPEVLSAAPRVRRIIRHLAGYAPAGADAGLAEMKNLSPRKAPALAVRRPREVCIEAVGEGKPHGMTMMNGQIYFVRGTTLYGPGSDGQPVAIGTVSDTDKVMIAFGGELLIFPDKVYLDRDTGTLKPMEIQTASCSGCQFAKNTIVLSTSYTWEGLGFRAGDCVSCYNANGSDDTPAGHYRLISISGRTATINASFDVNMSRTMLFARHIPDFSDLCVSGERLYGTVGGEVYVSAVGSAFDWLSPDTDDKGPCHLIAAGEGDFTACLPWQGYVIFFKKDGICKLVGNRSKNYVLTEIPAPGIPEGMNKTLCEVGGALYYYGTAGVYRYTGGYPETIGRPWGGANLFGVPEARYVSGVGGTDGMAYYVSLKTAEGTGRLFLYDPAAARFYAEDNLCPVATLTTPGFLIMQTSDGRILLTASDGRRAGMAAAELELVGASAQLIAMRPDDGGYWRPLAVTIRATAPEKATLTLKAAFSDGSIGLDATPDRAVTLGQVSGAMVDRRLVFPMVVAPCDGVVLFLEMSGEWEIGEISLACEMCR